MHRINKLLGKCFQKAFLFDVVTYLLQWNQDESRYPSSGGQYSMHNEVELSRLYFHSTVKFSSCAMFVFREI